MTSVSIRIKDFNLEFFRNKAPLNVLSNLNLEIQNGEFVVFIGPSGSGKTTLLKAIGGLITSDQKNVKVSGEITINDLSPSVAKKNKYFGFAFQNPVLLPWRNVEKNILLPLELLRISNENSQKYVDGVLKLLNIFEFKDSLPHQLSGGMQQRVNIGRAIIHNPKILLLDEPFGSLDEITREKLNFALHKIQRINKQTILFITHNISEAVLLADKIVILSNRPAKIIEVIISNLPPERDELTLKSKEYLDMLHKTKAKFFTINNK